MEVIILRLRNLGFEIKVVTRMADEDSYFITHIEAHKNGGAYKSQGFVHRTITPPTEELKSHIQKAESTIESTLNAKENVLKQEKPTYNQFNKIPLNWVPAGDILRP